MRWLSSWLTQENVCCPNFQNTSLAGNFGPQIWLPDGHFGQFRAIGPIRLLRPAFQGCHFWICYVSLKNKQLFYGTLFRITNGCHGNGILSNQKGWKQCNFILSIAFPKIKMILMSYWSISGVLTSDRFCWFIFLNCWKIPQNIKFHKKNFMLWEKITPNFFWGIFWKKISLLLVRI